jgi:hypothetical protein
MAYQAIESIDAHLQEELLEAYELFDNRGKGMFLLSEDTSTVRDLWRT